MLNNGVIPVLDVAILGQRQSRRLKLQPRGHWQLGGSLEVDKTHVHSLARLCRHSGVRARALGGRCLVALLQRILHDLGEMLLRLLVTPHDLT